MLHYLLYIIIQKGIPALGCLDGGLEVKGQERKRGKGAYRRERLHGALLWETLFTVWPSYCCSSCRGWMSTTASRQEENRTLGGFHHEEGAPGLLFLMVASEHSASDESPSESANCRGFWKEGETLMHIQIRNKSTPRCTIYHSV